MNQINIVKHCLSLITEKEDINDISDIILQKIIKLTNSQYGFIAEWKETYFHCLAITNISWNDYSRNLYSTIKTNNFNFHNMNTLFGVCGTTKKLVISNDVSNDKRSGGLPSGHPKLSNFAGIPLICENEFIGMIGIANKNGGYTEKYIKQITPYINIASDIIGVSIKQDTTHSDFDVIKDIRSPETNNLTHELRTPISSIIGMSMLLEKTTTLTETQHKYIKIIISSSNHLLSLINDLLDYSAIESQNIKLHKTPVNLITLVKEVSDMLSLKIKEKKLHYSYKIDAPIMLITDEKKIKQILINLISNSIKFTDKGSISLTICTEFKNSDEATIYFKIEDTGIGIPEDKLDIIFKPFKRINKNIQGSGLGLPITKNLSKLMGGDTICESKFGKGSVFTSSIVCNYF